MSGLPTSASGMKVFSYYPENATFLTTILRFVPTGYVLIEGLHPFPLSEWITDVNVPIPGIKDGVEVTVRDMNFDLLVRVEDFLRMLPDIAKDIEQRGVVLSVFSHRVPPSLYPLSLRNSRSRVYILRKNGLLLEVVFPHLGEIATIAGLDEDLLNQIMKGLEAPC